MHGFRKRVFALILLFILVLPGIAFASEYRIDDYKLNIIGKTKEFVLRDYLFTDEGTQFASEDELIGFLDDKKQVLLNRRIFTSVEYSYELGPEQDGVIPCIVSFFVDDGNTIMAIPYPKYDSNYGFKIGVKAYNRNLFGRFADLYFVGNISQNNLSFQKPTVYANLNLTNLYVNKMQFHLSATLLLDYFDSDNSKIEFEIGTEELMIGSVSLDISPWFKINPENDYDVRRWVLDEFGNTISFGPFLNQIGGISLFNKSIAYPVNKSLSTESHIEYLGFSKFFVIISIDTKSSLETGKLTKLRLGPTFGLDLNVSDWFSWRNAFSEYNTLYFGSNTVYEPSLEWDSTISRSSVDWIGDFREGLELKVYSEAEWFMTDQYRGNACPDKSRYYIESEIKWFPFALSWFNPSFRLVGTQSNINQYFRPSNTSLMLGDYIRGIKLNNDYITQTDEETRLTAFAFNANMTLKFIRIKEIAHSYIIPFFDCVVLSDSSNNGTYHTLMGVGFDGVVIFDKFPSFPIRASLGINLNDLIDEIKGTLTGSMEYELFFGMDFFF